MQNVIVSKRYSKRTPLFLRGHLETSSINQEVRIRDISVDGALLDAVYPLDVFEPITLICGRSRINGIVAWSKDGRAGVEFSEPVTGKTLTDSFENKLRVSAPKHYLVCDEAEGAVKANAPD